MKPTALLLQIVAAAALGMNTLAAAPTSKEPSAALNLARQLNQAFVEVAEKVSPSVVVIKVAQKQGNALLTDEGDYPYWEMLPRQFRKQFEAELEKRRNRQKERTPQEPEFNGQGSGFILREDGYILTNRHVVDGAEKIKVIFRDGREFPAVVRGMDPHSDLAVLKVDARGLPPAKLADSTRTRVGEFAIAIGAPFDLDYSITFGHVSAKGRSGIIKGYEGAAMDQDFIQTDANINPGNSGGPLVNIDGEVIGINTLIRGLHTGIGFAIPSSLAREISDRLITDGKITRSWLGISIKSLKEEPDLRLTIKGVKDGVVVSVIPPNAPAAKSELKVSDVITAVEGVAIVTVQDLRNQIRAKKPGTNVTLEVNRDGKHIKIKVQPGEMPENPTLAGNRRPSAAEAAVNGDLGVTVKPLTRELAGEFHVKMSEGVIVTEVEEDSPAERKGLKPGDIITEVNKKSVTSLKQFRDALKGTDIQKGIAISFISKGTSKSEVLKENAQ